MTEFTVQDMTCNSCVRRITKAITELDPQAKVNVDLGTKQVSIESTQNPEALCAKISGAGYTPVPITRAQG